MSVDKIILRAFLSTLAAIGLLFIAMLGALLLLFPSTMMEFTYSLGMENSSIRNAQRAYERKSNIYYIAYATQTAIEIENYKKIDSCGMLMIEDDEFILYCQAKNEQQNTDNTGDYKQYICGQVCIAQYKRGKKQEAVEHAFAWVEENAFPKNNAIVAVLLTSLRSEDYETANLIKGKMNERLGSLSETDRAYCDEILALVSE